MQQFGARKIYLAATHGVFCGNALERLNQAPIDGIVVTDTIPLNDERLEDKVTVLSIAPLLVWGPENGPWPGFFLQIWPNYTRYISGDLDGEGGAAFDLTTGWSITPTIVATATFQQNFDKDLRFYNPSSGSTAPNDWNLFAAVNFYF